MRMEAAEIASKTAVMVERLVNQEVERIERENSRVSMLIERDKMIDREIMAACIGVGIAVDNFKQAKFAGGSVEIRAREALDRASASLSAVLHKHKKMPK